MLRQTRVVVPALMLWALAAAPAAGQRFAGRVVSAATGTPLPGAVVQVLDGSGQPLATALSGTGGMFRLQGAFAAPVVVAVDMIGHARWTSESLSLAASDSAFLDVRMEVEPLPLDGLRAESESRCRDDRRALPVTQELWQDITTALQAERLSRAAGRHRFRVETYERDYAPGDALVVRERRTVRTTSHPEAFRSASDSVLLARGFLEERDDGTYLLGPTSAVVLASWFVDTHCLTVAPPDERNGALGVRFTPNEARRVPEIAGTVWVDATTRDLHSIEYEYVSLPRHLPTGAYRGTVTFRRLDDGALFVTQWTISSPIVAVGEVTVFDERRQVERDGGRRESGGEVLRVQVGSDTLYRANRATLVGTVTDSVNVAPLAGARVVVVGTSYEATTDALGRYRIDELPDGSYRVRFTHPGLSRFDFVHEPVGVRFARGDTARLDLFLPADARLRFTDAELARLDSIASLARVLGLHWDIRVRSDSARAAVDRVTVHGRVIDTGGSPIVRATVVLEPADRASGNRDQRAITDANGQFELVDVPVAEYTVTVRADGYAPWTMPSAVLEPGNDYGWLIRLGPEGEVPPAAQAIDVAPRASDPRTTASRADRADAADPAALFGRVTDADTGRPLADATVRVGDSVVATDRRGRFELRRMAPGNHVLTVEMLGYAQRTDSLALEAGAAYDVDVRLTRRPIELAPIAVTVRSPALERAGFYERISSGLSPHVITAAEFERRGWDRMVDAFQGLPNVRVEQNGFGRRIVRMTRGPSSGLRATERSLPGCEPALYIDGQVRRDQISSNPDEVWVLDWNVLSPLTIEAIEIYSGASTPVEYPHPCGVVLVWTRR